MEDDELCEICTKVDVYSLFTGPRSPASEGTLYPTPLGTLQDVKINVHCPLCRLVKHGLTTDPGFTWWESTFGDFGTGLWCSLESTRADILDEAIYDDPRTHELVATRVRPCLSTDQIASRNTPRMEAYGISLLSPDSIDPARPLLYGFRTTNMNRKLTLLSEWIGACDKYHGASCRPELPAASLFKFRPTQILVIDVQDRRIYSRDPANITYAALSYVWGQAQEEYIELSYELQVERDTEGNKFILLPDNIPQIIEDALLVCKRLSLPYPWADLYCIHQDDSGLKTLEIEGMGYIYYPAHITLVDASINTAVQHPPNCSWLPKPAYSRLLPENLMEGPDAAQQVETIRGRRYISALPPMKRRLFLSTWSTRGWTYQEGQMSRRIAFFGGRDISFLCGCGHWRESLHSRPFRHNAHIPDVNLTSTLFDMLRVLNWMKPGKWEFKHYKNMLFHYSSRVLLFESDKLNAISGCLHVLGQQRGTRFLHGLPTIDFHYALLWSGEDDQPRTGFPSWFWAGWHAYPHGHAIFPNKDISGSLISVNADIYEYKEQQAPDIELEGLPLDNKQCDRLPRKCSLHPAPLSVSEADSTITIRSEVVKFSIDISVQPSHGEQPGSEDPENKILNIPLDFDSTSAILPSV